MSETTLLKFSARAVTSGQTEILEIEVKVGEAPLGDPLLIDLKIPVELVDERISAAVELARDSDTPKNMASLADLVAVGGGLSAWVFNDVDEHLVTVRAVNYLDLETGATLDEPTGIEANATFTLRIPLAEQASGAQIQISYLYKYGNLKGAPVQGTLELSLKGASDWKPQVSLTTDKASSTMITPGQKVKISWKIIDAVSATLRGPLPGGNSELTLSRDRASNFWIENGWFEIYATGPVTYVLDAEVRGPQGQPNVQVIRTLTLAVYTADQYAGLDVRPRRVLPNGVVEIHWAVWGVNSVTLSVGIRKYLNLVLTEQDSSRTYQGMGTVELNALSKPRESVSLSIEHDDPQANALKTAEIFVTPWIKIGRRRFSGKPLGLAVVAPQMALLTSDGLWIATVGRTDNDLKDPSFRKVSPDEPRTWLALTAFEKGFAALWRTAENELRLARYNSDGAQQSSPVDLPKDIQALVSRPGTIYDLVEFRNRVYVSAEGDAESGPLRRAFSVRFEPQAESRSEPLIEQLPRYRLLSFNNALYALNRISGQMFRFDLTANGALDKPRKAASATRDGKSLIRKGLPVPAGPILVVLDPSLHPTHKSLTMFLSNVLACDVKTLIPERKPEDVPQDLIYNPQKNEWTQCGHGLEIKEGAVAAFRGGDSKRLWVLQPDGEMETLTGASPELFTSGYIERLPSAPLPPALDAKREFTIRNGTGIDLVPMDDACRAAGLDGLKAMGLAEVEPLPDKFPHGTIKTFTISYNEADPGTVKIRFLVPECRDNRYLLELTFSGRGLSSVTSVFKRLAPSGQVAEVPETSAQHPADSQIVVPHAWRLNDRIMLDIVNATPSDLRLFPLGIPDFGAGRGEVNVTYNTPNFYIIIPQLDKFGQLQVQIDFAMPAGIEMSPSNEPQRNMFRIVTDHMNMLDVRAQVLKANGPDFDFETYDGIRGRVLSRGRDSYMLVVGLKRKKEWDGIRLGDAVASTDGLMLYIPMAKPKSMPNAEILVVYTNGYKHTSSPVEIGGGVFSVPNSVTIGYDKVYAMFGNKILQENDRFLGSGWGKKSITDYDEISALVAHRHDVFMVAKKDQWINHEKIPSYFLLVEQPNGSRLVVPLDKINHPVLGPPLAVSQDGKRLAICHQGGLLVGGAIIPNINLQPVKLASAREPAYVTFSRDGQWIYCAHMTRAIGVNPRRAVAGRDLTVSRVRVSNLNETQSISLPNVEGNFALTGNTRKSFPVGAQSKEEVAFTLAVSPDNRALFVSAGKSILKIDTASFTLLPWRAEVELPCRLIYVKEAQGNAWTIYALGSYYVGDGTSVDEYKTHLYAIPAPKN